MLTVKATSQDDILKQIKEDTERLAIVFTTDDGEDSVTRDLKLRTAGSNGCDIEWTSNRPGIIGASGQVSPSEDDTPVVLTARVSKYSNTIGYVINRMASFTVNVIAKEAALIDVDADLDDVEIGYAKGDSAQSVTAAMYFATTGKTGSQITWASDNVSYVTDTGLVKRPSPDEGDKKITIRATVTNPASGKSKTRVFEITVKKLSDQEAVAGAARALTINDAIEFSEGDYWESVTSSFWVLMTGKNDTNITWSTNSPAIVVLGDFGNDGRQVAKINRPQTEDKSVILTATISKGTCSVKKTFLLIVKKVQDVKTTTREDSQKTILATLGGGEQSGSQNFSVMRTTLTSGGGQTRVDTVVLDSEKMDQLTSRIDPDGTPEERRVSVAFARDEADPADEQTIEVPSDVVGMLADKNASLQIDAGGTRINLDPDDLQALADQGTDLYLRVVPLTDEQKQAQVAAQAQAQAQGATMVSMPYVIETNYVGIETTVILPVTGKLENPDNVRVYIQHSDGTIEIMTGTVVYSGGEPVGIEITISHFSTFQVMELPAADTDADTDEGDDSDVNNEEEEQVDIQPTETPAGAAEPVQQPETGGVQEPVADTGQHDAYAAIKERLIEKDGKYYALVTSVAGKTLVLVCGPEDMPAGGQDEIKAAMTERFGSDIILPEGEFTLSDLAALILMELDGIHSIIGG